MFTWFFSLGSFKTVAFQGPLKHQTERQSCRLGNAAMVFSASARLSADNASWRHRCLRKTQFVLILVAWLFMIFCIFFMLFVVQLKLDSNIQVAPDLTLDKPRAHFGCEMAITSYRNLQVTPRSTSGACCASRSSNCWHFSAAVVSASAAWRLADKSARTKLLIDSQYC